MKLKLKKTGTDSLNRISINFIAVFITIITILMNNNGKLNIFAAILVLILGCITLYRVYKNLYLFIIYLLILYFNYSICIANYLFKIESYFTSYANQQVGVTGVNILLVFSLTLLLIAPKVDNNKKQKICLTENNKYNPIIAFGLAIIMMLIWIFGFTRPDVAGERGTPSTYYEYAILLLIIGVYYSGKNKLIHYTYVGIAIGYALQNFIYGGRITGLQILICVVLSIYIDRLNLKLMLPIVFVFFVLMTGIGQFRTGFQLSSNILSSVMKQLENNKFTLDTAYSSYFTSLTFVLTKDMTSVLQQWKMFLLWVLSMICGGGISNSNLATYTRKFFLHYGGGVLPYFWYFYLGMIGIFIIGFFLKILFRRISIATSESKGLDRCIAIYITTSVFRWYLYSPSNLFRGILILSVCYFLAYIADSFMNNRYSFKL